MFPEFFDRVMDENQSGSASVPSSRSEIFVVSIGGSVFMQENFVNTEAIRRIAASINTLASEGYKFALVVGGGGICRSYLEAGKRLGLNKFALDELGIAITKTNAFLFVQAIEKASLQVLTSFESAPAIIEQGKIPVFGGLFPGATTDYIAALLTEKLNGTFVNLSDTDGVYSSDPATNKRAKLFRELSFERLLQIAVSTESKPGQHSAIDIPAALILKRSALPAIFVNGNSLENFENAVKSRPFNGTVVQTSDSETDSIKENPEITEETETTINPEDIEGA